MCGYEIQFTAANSSKLLLTMMTNAKCSHFLYAMKSFSSPFPWNQRQLRNFPNVPRVFRPIPMFQDSISMKILINLASHESWNILSRSILFYCYSIFKCCVLVHGNVNHHKFHPFYILSSINLSTIIMFCKKVIIPRKRKV